MGKEMATAFTAAGAIVTVGDMQDCGQQLVEELGQNRVAFVKCDVTNWADQVNLFKTALALSPSHRLDIVIANAGISGRDSLYWDGESTTCPWYSIRTCSSHRKQTASRVTSQ